jgi:hypothetical protein
MNNKTLLYIFVALLAIYMINKVLSKPKERSFDPNIVFVDTAKVDEIRLFPKAESGAEIILRKQSSEWSASKGTFKVNAPGSSIQSILTQLSNIKAKRIVSKSPDKWTEYEVDDENGSKVEVFSAGKKIESFIVGAFKFDQANRSASSYVRKDGSDEVYIVDGFLSMQFNQGFDAFRDKKLLELSKEDIRELTLSRAGQENVGYQKIEDIWYYAGMEKVDSASMAQYLNGLASVFGSEFADDFQPSGLKPEQSLMITGNNMLEPVIVDCYRTLDAEKPFVLHNKQNQDSWFSSDSTGVFDRIFGEIDQIQKDVE